MTSQDTSAFSQILAVGPKMRHVVEQARNNQQRRAEHRQLARLLHHVAHFRPHREDLTEGAGGQNYLLEVTPVYLEGEHNERVLTGAVAMLRSTVRSIASLRACSTTWRIFGPTARI
jgi:transcriptional regulator of aromatic amino acid metabolism